jgi:MFS transporter, DHA2 family, multidrug resistance protein
MLPQTRAAPGEAVMIPRGVASMVRLATDVIVSAAPADRAGVAAALSESGAEIGGALGVAVFGSVGAAAIRRRK